MCGFVVIINSKIEKKKLSYSLKNLKKINTHRGPDNIRVISNKNYSILFRRLKILDLHERSDQPFQSENGKITIVFNGEIYNFLEVKEELKRKNISFKTESDTEVVLRSYQFWGPSFVKKLRGMFSIIVLDDEKRRYLCLRDRLGQKPLYYSKYRGGLIFSSEIKDIIFFKKKDEILENKKKFRNFFFKSTDLNDNTFFENIHMFPPRSLGVIDKSSIKIKTYWDLDIKGNKKFNINEFKDIYKDNLKLHLRSDVPIAFTLSGGLDSSSIVNESLNFNLKNTKCYSLISNFDKKNYEIDEIELFKKKNSINHEFVNVDLEKNTLENFIESTDEPNISPSFLPQFLLRKKIKKDGFKVLITGEGSDEALGGYNRMLFPYLYIMYISKNKKIPSQILNNKIFQLNQKNFYGDFDKNKNNNYDYFIEDRSSADFMEVPKDLSFKDNFYLIKNFKKKNGFKQLLKNHLLIKDLPLILKTEDSLSMSQSIESRTPFIDHVLLEYIFSIKEENFLKNGESKHMLRTAFKKKFHKSFLTKKKIGRPSSINTYIFKVYFEKLREMLNSKKYENPYFSNKKILITLLNDYKSKNFKRVQFYFKVLSYFIWKDNFNLS